MIRELINIRNLPYVVELYDAYDDNIVHYEQFVMFRNYDIYNDVFADKELYFVNKKVWDSTGITGNLIWPICEELGSGFANEYKYFNGLFSDYGLEHGYDVNILYNKFRNVANVRCNMVRIYRPTVKTNNDIIIHVDNFINNIHMHYLCTKYNSCPINSNDEFKLNNVTYSEYIEFYVPNIYDLFDNDKLNNHVGCYFKENLNMVDFFSNVKKDLLFIDDKQQHVYFPLDIFSLPYILKEKQDDDGDTYTVKCYTSVSKSIENNYISYPVNITLWSFNDIVNNKYVRDDFWGEASATFIKDLKFTLCADLGFVNNTVSVVAHFDYPDREEFIKKYKDDEDSAVLHAYMKYNNVKKDYYSDYKFEMIEKYKEELELTHLDETDKIIVNDYFKRRGEVVDVNNETELREKYKEMKLQSLYDELNEDRDTNLDFIGFRIIIGSDPNFKHIIYDNNVKIKFEQLDDFSFNINDIFESWSNVYDGYYAVKVLFVDRLLGTEIISNSVVLSPEWVKYMIHSSNERIINFDNINNIDKDNEIDMEYNFIENIRCIVNKKQNDKDKVVRGNNSPKLLYRPMFYRASNLQNVRIRRNVKQKIGINLAEYMTKVETFKLLLNGNEYIEYGRSDAFVIFEISGNNFSTTSGAYDILNQDDEYISSGTYSLI